MTEYYERRGAFIKKFVESSTDSDAMLPYGAFRHLHIETDKQQIQNDNTDTETVTVKAVNGLDVARGNSPTVLDYDGDLTLSVDGQQTTKTLTNGSVSFDIITDKSAGSEIEVVAESLSDHPAESDSATIEVVSQ